MTQGYRRVAAVTGAGQGLGRAIAIAFAEADFDLVLLGRSASKLKQTSSLVAANSLILPADLTDPDQVRGAFASIEQKFGGLDALINNAGGYVPFPIEQATDEEIAGIVGQNLMLPIYCLREAIPLLRKRGVADIVNISSQSADMPQPHMIVYGAAKAGLEAISQGLRYELKGERIRVTTLQPGVIQETDFDPLWDDRRESFRAALKNAGIAEMFSFPGSSANSIAAAVVHAVTAPRDISFETIKVR
jgi:NADP-dependent 3-hydroxy acid dehydrogenase YdfG